jgi:hypothetical protein
MSVYELPYESRIQYGDKIYVRHFASKDEAIEQAVKLHVEGHLDCLACDLRDMSCVLHLEGITL